MTAADINEYWKGQAVKVSASFTDEDGEAVDPDVVKLSYTNPSGDTVTLEYGEDEELFTTAAGHYEVIIDADEAGRWYYRWWSTGDGQASEQFHFEVVEVAGG